MKNQQQNIINVTCPTCQSEVEWNEHSPYRPFCSKRCQLIDFGEWATEEKYIAGNPSDNTEYKGDD